MALADVDRSRGPLPPEGEHYTAAEALARITGEGGAPVYGASIEYRHEAALPVLPAGPHYVVTKTDPAPRIAFRLDRNGLPAGLVRIRYGESYDRTTRAADAIRRGAGGAWTLTHEILIPPRGATSLQGFTGQITVIRNAGGVQIGWTAIAGEDVMYRVYASTRAEDIFQHPVGHTPSHTFQLTGLREGEAVYVLVKAENGAGETAGTNTPTRVDVPAAPEAAPTFLRRAPLRSCTIAPGGVLEVDLGDHLLPVRRASEELDLASRWSDTEIAVTTIGGEVTASVSGTTVTLAAPALAEPGQAQTLVLVRLRRTGSVPVWTGLVAGVGEETRQTAYTYGPAHASRFAGSRALAEAFAGSAPVLVDQGDWHPALDQAARQMGKDLRPRRQYDGIPEVAVLKGSLGYALIILGTDPGAEIPETPFLPPGALARVEEGGAWVDVSLEAVAHDVQAARSVGWRRVLTSASRLFETSPHAPPAELYYAPPRYYGTAWFDQALYPADARLEGGRVVYRSGLRTGQAAETAPVIEDLTATVLGLEADVRWRALSPVDGHPLAIALPLYVGRTGGPATRTMAAGAARIKGLAAGQTYRVRLLADEAEAPGTTFETAPPRAVLRVEGRRLASGYAYTYTLTGGAVASWRDALGQEHAGTSGTAESEAPIHHHAVEVVSAQGDRYVLEAATEWSLPLVPLSLESEVVVGRIIPAPSATPVFGRATYSGTASRTLPANVYGPGTATVYAEGVLPPGLEGALEDYVRATFVDVSGRELGDKVELGFPRELLVKLTVTASAGLSPQVYGARVVVEPPPN